MSNISLRGFDNIDPSEITIVQDRINKTLKKIDFSQLDYDLLKINLKQHKHSGQFLHELKADLFLSKGRALNAKSEDRNLYKAIDDIMKKLLNEIKHKFKKD